MPFVPAPEPVAGVPSGVVDEDLLCNQCGYNLRGLKKRGVCPECGHAFGTSSSANSRRLGSKIETLPAAELRRVSRGCLLVLSGWAALMGWMVCRLWGVEALMTGPMMAAGAAGVFFGATLLAPAGFALRGGAAWKTPIGAAMLCILAGAGSGVLVEGARLAGWSGPAVAWVNVFSILAWFAAQCLLCVRMSSLAADASDDSLASRFWGLMWACSFFGPFGVLSAALFLQANLMVCIGILFIPAALIGCQVAFAVFVIQLSRNYQWAIRYQASLAGRDRRLRERMERERRGGAG